MTPSRQSTISINILGSAVKDENRMWSFLDRLNPTCLMVVGNGGMACKAQSQLPDCKVIYRHWVGDVEPPQNRGDDHLANMHNPAWYVDEAIRQVPDKRVIIHVGNELHPSEEASTFLVGALDELDKRRRIGAVYGVAVGNEETNEYAGVLAPLLRRLSGTEHYLSIHEYGDQFDMQWGLGHLIGRYENYLFPACERLGIEPPRLVITEHGFDSLTDGFNGWKDRVSQEFYAEELGGADWYYREKGHVLGQCIYAWGDRFNFDIQHAYTLQELLIQHADEMAGTPPVHAPNPPTPEPEPPDHEARIAALEVVTAAQAELIANLVAQLSEMRNALTRAALALELEHT